MRTYKHYIIYKITNKVNGKIYIGKHKCDDLDDGYFGSGKCLFQEINKYGIENFEFHLEIDLKNQEEMDLLEECVVNEDFLARTDVYNLSRGGKNPCLYGKNNPFYGKTHSKEICEKTSKRFKGIKLTEKHKDKIGKSLKKLYFEHPEICLKFATRKGKKKCINQSTGQIKFFDPLNIPDNFEIYIRKTELHHVSDEQKAINKEIQRERNRNSRWYNNGLTEIFSIAEKVPNGFVLGRLPTTNVGRKASAETREKMSLAKRGKDPSNKGKIFITNGYENRYIKKDSPIPNGWKHGLTHKRKNI